MVGITTADLTLRIGPALQDVLRTATQREHRSVSNKVEVLIQEYCRRVDVPIEGADQAARNLGEEPQA
jgi:hypothetical protein